MTTDGLLSGADMDAFELGSNEVEVCQSRNAAVNANRVTSGTSDTGCVAPEGQRMRLVGDLASPTPSRSEPI